jgi:hypothetical protein
MNAQEQITGVINILDHARSVTVSGKPVVIKRDDFEQYPDYEAVLEKIAKEYSAIKVIQYPVMDDVDYRANIGFYPEADLNSAISYQIEVLSNFDDLLAQRKGVLNTENLHATVLVSGNKVLLSLSDGTQIELASQRTDSAEYSFMRYVWERPKVYLKVSDIDPIEHSFTKHNLSELARLCGFDKVLKTYFFPDTEWRKRIHFVQENDVPKAIIDSRRKS